MKSSFSLPRAAALAAFAVLAAPVAASAHPGVYTVTQKVRPAGATCEFPIATCLTDVTQYAIANDGWALGLTEDNGVKGVQADPAGTAGMVDYKAMPGNWRTAMTSEQKRTFAGAQTDVQAHATCSGSALLDTAANVLAWQGADPFFNYIPWQSTSASLGDEPSKWIPVVKNATGVDLSSLSGEAAFRSACESAPVSGDYHKADTPAAIDTAALAAATAPLQTQVSTLQSQVAQLQNGVTALQAAKAASDTAAATTETARQALVNRPLMLTLAGKSFSVPVAMVTGTAGTAVTVTVKLSSAGAKALKIAQTIATKKTTLDAQGAELLTAKLTTKAAKAIKKHRHAMKVTVTAAGGGKTDSASGSLTS